MPITHYPQHPKFRKDERNTKLNFIAVYTNSAGKKCTTGFKTTFAAAARIAEKHGGEVLAAYTAS